MYSVPGVIVLNGRRRQLPMQLHVYGTAGAEHEKWRPRTLLCCFSFLADQLCSVGLLVLPSNFYVVHLTGVASG